MHFYCKYLVSNTQRLRYDLQMTSTSQFQDLFLKFFRLLLNLCNRYFLNFIGLFSFHFSLTNRIEK